MRIPPWAVLPEPWPPLAGRSHTMSAESAGEGADTVGLCETWRAWEAGTNSEFLNWFLFTPHGTSSGTSSATETAVLEAWICFKHDRSELDDRARAVLGAGLELFRANPGMRIVIGGLAAQPGTVDSVMRLGLRRVLSIRTFLLAHGVDPGRIGIAVRGSGWSVAERSGGSEDPTNEGCEYRLQVTDPHWTLARN